MLQQKQLIRDAPRFPILDERLLQREAVGVADHAQPAHLDLAADGDCQIQASSNFSSRSFKNERNRPASAPSISR